MKKFFALLAVVLAVVSCQKDVDVDVNVGSEVDTVVTVSLPETTRANSAEGAFVNVVESDDYTIRYIFQVFYNDTESQAARQVIYTDNDCVSFPVRLVPDRHYNFVVWADVTTTAGKTLDTIHKLTIDEAAAADIHYNTKDLTNITLKNTWVAMDETRDAFTGHFDTAVDGDKTPYNGAKSINFRLTRPFAKLRIITTDMEQLNDLDITPNRATVEYTTDLYSSFNAFAGAVNTTAPMRKTHSDFAIEAYDDNVDNKSKVLFTDYFFAADQEEVVNFTLKVYDQDGVIIGKETNFNTPIPARRNYLTTISGNILTDGNNITVEVENSFAKPDIDVEWKEASTAQEFVNIINEVNNSSTDEETHIVLGDDIDLNDLFNTRAAYTALTINSGKAIKIDLNEKVLSATTNADSGNQELFLVKGQLTIINGTIEYVHVGQNMGWDAMTTIFDVTAGGVLNLEGVTATNKGGSDMGFVAHLNTWGEVTLNVDNCPLESNYVPVRVFNSGNDMNNVTIKNSTLKGVSAAFWVHKYTVEDFGSEAKAEAQKALLNFDIFDNSNTFSPIVGIRYGFTNSIRFDSYGITRTVSEDGSEVTLGVLFGEDGVVRRGVVGNEENTTIKKVVVGEGISTLYDRTFRRFYALEEVVLPSTLTTIGAAGSGVFQSCTNLKTIVIPESVTVLGKGSFQECSSLESINIPTGVTRIESDALRATGLKSVEFHAGVTYFGAQAFRDCKQLTEVIINAPEFTMESNTFGIMSGVKPAMTIYVVNAEMKAYVESKLTSDAKNYITVKAPVAVTDKDSLQAEMAKAIKDGEKNIYIDATNFSGDLNYGFSNANLPAGVTVTVRNAKVTATSKSNYLNGTLIFENCEFTAGLYSIHFDDNDGVGDVIFKNCKLVGWLPFSSINSVSFENCHLTGNGSYALIRSYADLTLKNCIIDTTLANHTDAYTDGVQVIGATLTEENVTYIDNHTAYLQNVLKAGKHVVLSSDLTISSNEGITAPYGNKTALSQNGGVFDGNGKTITADLPGDNYIYMTNGGTTKNLNVTGAFRGIMIMSANQTVRLENVVSGGTGVVYALNTGEGDSTQDLVATNCTFNGWSSWSLLKSATFTNCSFGQGSEYSNVIGRLGKPYVNTVFDGCHFCGKYYIDLSAFVGTKVTFKNCTVNGVKITAENWASLVAPEDTCGEGQISVELKDGSYLTAENVADYIVFE